MTRIVGGVEQMKCVQPFHTPRLVCVILILGVLGWASFGCDGNAGVGGTVYEAPEGMRSGRAPADFAGGKPLEGVEVILYRGKSTSASPAPRDDFTFEDGGYYVVSRSYTRDDKYLVSFSKAGYEPFSTIVEIPRTQNISLDVCLAPINPAFPDGPCS